MTTANVKRAEAATMPNPEKLLQLGTAFWASKVFLAALKFKLFTLLADGPLSEPEIRARLKLHPRGSLDWLDALAAVGALTRGDGRYGNTPETQTFFNEKSPAYIGGMLEMANERLYGFWGRLETALETGLPQNETMGGKAFFDTIYADPKKTRLFSQAMIGLSLGSSAALVQAFDFGKYRRFCDLGGGPGTLAVQVARAYPKVEVVNFDLPQAESVFADYVKGQGMTGKLKYQAGDCLSDPFPPADVYAMGHLLHGWGGGPETQRVLAKAHAALPEGGTLLVIESLIDDERIRNPFGLLMSLDMLLETETGRNFTGAEVSSWLRKAGFRQVEVKPLAGPHSVAIAVKGA